MNIHFYHHHFQFCIFYFSNVWCLDCFILFSFNIYCSLLLLKSPASLPSCLFSKLLYTFSFSSSGSGLSSFSIKLLTENISVVTSRFPEQSSSAINYWLYIALNSKYIYICYQFFCVKKYVLDIVQFHVFLSRKLLDFNVGLLIFWFRAIISEYSQKVFLNFFRASLLILFQI